MNFLKDFCASIRNFIGGRSDSYENELIKAREKTSVKVYAIICSSTGIQQKVFSVFR